MRKLIGYGEDHIRELENSRSQIWDLYAELKEYLKEITAYVERNIPDFHRNRLEKLKALQLRERHHFMRPNHAEFR